MISSIGKLFSPEHYQSSTSQEVEDCFPCVATSAGLLLGLGAAFSSGVVFKSKDGKPLGLSRTYVRSVRFVGALLVPLGLYRSWQAWELYKEENQKA